MTPLEMQKEIERLAKIIDGIDKSDKYLFSRKVQMGDGRNFQLGLSEGTMIGTTASEKVGFQGTTPVVQQGALSDLVFAGSADDSTARARCNAITAVLKAYGLIA